MCAAAAIFSSLSGDDVDETQLAAVAALEARCFTQPWGAASLRSTLSQAGAGVALLGAAVPEFAPAELLAFCLYQQIVDELHILQMATHPAARRCGHARALLSRLQQQARSRGCVEMLLEVRHGNTAAVALYKALGFQLIATRRGYYADGEDALILRCLLCD